MEERNSNIAPWLLLIFSVVIATVGWWFYFGEHATSTRQEQELSSIKKQYVSETAELRERLSKLENNRDKLLQSTQEIKGDFNGLENRLKRLGDKLAEANSSNKRLTEKLATASADKELLNNQLSLLRKETSLLQEELNTAEARRTSLESEKELLGIERERYKAEAERLGSQYQELKQSLAKEKTLLTSTIETLEKQSAVLERELESAVAARDEAFNEKENLLKERNNFSAQIDELLNEITQLKSQLAAKNAAESTMKDDLKLLLNERKHLRAQLKGLGVDLEKTGSEFKRKNAALEAEKKQLSNALDELQRKLENEKMAASVAIQRVKDDYAVITLDVDAFFARGSARLNQSIFSVLDKIADSLEKSPNRRISVEGHTDNLPIRSSSLVKIYPSNWELSAARASSAVRYLLETNKGLSPKRLLAIGLGEYHPIADNDTPEGRKRNRRIEIKLLPEGL